MNEIHALMDLDHPNVAAEKQRFHVLKLFDSGTACLACTWPSTSRMGLHLAAEVKLVRYFDQGRYMYLVFELCEGNAEQLWTGPLQVPAVPFLEGPDLQSRLEQEGRLEEKEAMCQAGCANW